MTPNVIVTGGSRGLGLAIARKLRGAGYSVIAIARGPSEPLAAAMREGGAGALHFRPYDLAETGGLAALVKAIKQDHGPIFGLVNNAAIGPSGILATMRDAEIERAVRLNTLSPILLT